MRIGAASLISLLALAALETGLHAGTGTTSAQILRVGMNARASAMGDAYCAVSDDIGAIYWNPAGLSQADSKQASFTYANLFQEFGVGQAGYIHPIKGDFTVGAGFCYLDSGDVPKTLATNRGLYTGNDGTFKATSYVISIGASDSIMRDLVMGVNVKNVAETIDTYKGQGFAVDFGLMYKLLAKKQLVFAASMANAMGTIQLGGDSARMPLTVSAGSSYKFGGFLLSVERKQTSDSGVSYHSGMEYAFGKSFFLRAGYNSIYASRVSMGFGAALRDIQVDYAAVQSEYLGYVHKATMTLKFGERIEREDKMWLGGDAPWYMR